MRPNGRYIYFSMALSIGIEHRSGGYDVIPQHAAEARHAIAQKNLS